MHDAMPYGRNQGQGQGHSTEVDRQSPTGLIFNSSPIVTTGAKYVFLCLLYSLHSQTFDVELLNLA